MGVIEFPLLYSIDVIVASYISSCGYTALILLMSLWYHIENLLNLISAFQPVGNTCIPQTQVGLFEGRQVERAYHWLPIVTSSYLLLGLRVVQNWKSRGAFY